MAAAFQTCTSANTLVLQDTVAYVRHVLLTAAVTVAVTAAAAATTTTIAAAC